MGRGKRTRANNAAASVLLALIATALQDVAVATEYTVGNATGWDFAPTTTYYDDWASGFKFVPGDKLVFKYLPVAHNVQEVNEADYRSCNSLIPITEYETGNDVVTLTKPGTRYYICGFLGHCDEGGMRMKTTTIEQVSSAPLIPAVPPASPPVPLPSPMTSTIPQLPPAASGTPPRAPHGGHAHPPANAPITVPGHSAADPTHVVGIMMSSFGVAAGAAAPLLFW